MIAGLHLASIEAAASEGRVYVATCGECGSQQALPGTSCFTCGANELTVREHDGTGTVYTWTTTDYAFDEHAQDDVPVTPIVVTLTGGARIYGRLSRQSVVRIAADLPVRLDVDATRTCKGLVFSC